MMPPIRFARARVIEPTFGGALIAVIDDELTVVEGMRAWLAQSGAVVVGAGSGKDMLTALGEHGRYPDLIVADYRLGGGALGPTRSRCYVTSWVCIFPRC
jgi:hypothetical protein